MAREWGPEDFVAGHVALDFTNTVGGFLRERVERVEGYADLVAWARSAAVVDDGEAAALTVLAEASPSAAREALDEVLGFREALARWLTTAVTGEGGDEADRARVARGVLGAHRAARPGPDPIRGPAWLLTVDDVGLALPGLRLALVAAALLASDDRQRIGRCGRCSWLFLDPSPSRRRRWCSMATCGNRAKAARHHARTSEG